MGKYVRYTDEQKEAADSVRISEILDAEGEKYKKWGKQFQWQRHDSVIFVGSKWFQHSQGRGGGAIEFCKTFLNKTFPEAMEYLLENFRSDVANEANTTDKATCGERSEKNHANRRREDGVFLQHDKETKGSDRASPELPEGEMSVVVPKANETTRNLYRYLIKERGIDPTVVSFFVRSGRMYETEKGHGVAFVGRDESGRIRNVHVRGTHDGAHGKFRMTAEGSDFRYGFGYQGEGQTLYVFEAPIDLLSFLCLYPKDWMKNSYLSLNGVSGQALFHFLVTRPDVTSVVLCLDNDKAGQEACVRLSRELTGMGYQDVRMLSSLAKDWNEDLVSRGREECLCSPSLV
ncbi:MAG: DUF3991 and TOPRIM domain-containing protein [Lachnospiraceae bacterium]|nr:DUF3991 and TOPRIM domain-containing protein [Lachnospiraceae bacterium]